MIGKILIFLGIVLLIVPTWLHLQTFTSSSKSFISRLLKSVKIVWQRSEEQSEGGILISSFQRWGLLWLFSGVAIQILGDRLPGYLLGVFIIGALLFGPVFIYVVFKKQLRQVKSKRNVKER